MIPDTLQALWKLVQSLRSLFFRKRQKKIFWERYNQVKLLLYRLNDDDIHSAEVSQLLEIDAENRLHACCLAFRSYAILSAKSSVLEIRGFELLESWRSSLSSITRHLEENLFPQLRGDDRMKLDDAMAIILSDVLKLPEVQHAWVA